jgi:hypothetical protein
MSRENFDSLWQTWTEFQAEFDDKKKQLEDRWSKVIQQEKPKKKKAVSPVFVVSDTREGLQAEADALLEWKAERTKSLTALMEQEDAEIRPGPLR